MAVNEALRAGRYGRTVRRGDVIYADLSEVERVENIKLSDDQIACAVDGKPDRVLVITENEQEDAA